MKNAFEYEAELTELREELAATKVRENLLLNNPKTVFKQLCDEAIKQRNEFSQRLTAAEKEIDAAQSELTEYQKILASYKNNYVTKLAYNAVQSSLTAAEQRNAKLVELLKTINAKACKSHVSQSLWQLKTDMANIAQATDAAFKPTESGARE